MTLHKYQGPSKAVSLVSGSTQDRDRLSLIIGHPTTIKEIGDFVFRKLEKFYGVAVQEGSGGFPQDVGWQEFDTSGMKFDCGKLVLVEHPNMPTTDVLVST